jgi:hypothetical protein
LKLECDILASWFTFKQVNLYRYITGFYHEDTQAWIVSLPDIWRRYVLSWFLIDVIALVPLEFIVNHGRLGRSVKLLRMKKLMSGVKHKRLASNFLSRNEIDPQAFELMQQVFIASACVHVVCCAWCFVLLFEQRIPEGWPGARDGMRGGGGRPHVASGLKKAYEWGFSEDGSTPLNWVAANEVFGAEFEYYVAAMQLLFQGEMQPSTLIERIMLIISMGLFYMVRGARFVVCAPSQNTHVCVV